MAGVWRNLAEGEERVFGLFQIDIVKSSTLRGPDRMRQMTKANLRKIITGILENVYGARKLSWPGDGGSFIFLISRPDRDYDNMVTAALHVLETLSFFNAMKGIHNLLDQDVSVRISCHKGQANYSKNVEEMHGNTLNYFLKHEREIGVENTVTITEDVYSQVASKGIRDMFQFSGQHDYAVDGQRLSRGLYGSKGRRTELVVEDSLVEETLVTAVKAANRFVAVISGKGGTERYLTELTKKARVGGISYWRLVTGDHIPHLLCEHLRDLLGLQNVRLARDPSEHYGVILATEKQVVFTSASPKGGRSFVAAVVPEPALGEMYREFMVDLFAEKTRITTEDEIKKLCTSCRVETR